MTPPPNAITLRELAFVRDVLIPRVWVQGAEVDELLRLRARINRIFARAQAPQEMRRPEGEAQPAQGRLPRREGKKPRHPKKGRGKPQPPGN